MKNITVILDPRTRLLALLFLTPLIFTCEEPAKLAVTALISLSFPFVTGDRPREILKAIKPVIILVVVLLVLQIFFSSWSPHFRWRWPSLSEPVLREAALMGIRLFSVLWLAAWSTSQLPVTKMAAVTEWLLSPLKVLGFKTESVGLAMVIAVRFIPEMQKEARLIDEGQRLRGKRTPRGNPMAYARELLNFLVPLMARAMLRAEQMAEAIQARGYGIAEHPEHLEELRFRISDLVFMALLLLTAGYVGFW